jgi:hypothetical protein
LTASLIASCANIQPRRAEARGLTPAEQQTLNEVRAYLEDYYQNRDLTPGITAGERTAIDAAMAEASNLLLTQGNGSNWNPSFDGKPFEKPPGSRPSPGDGDDDESVYIDLSKALQKKRNELNNKYYNNDVPPPPKPREITPEEQAEIDRQMKKYEADLRKDIEDYSNDDRYVTNPDMRDAKENAEDAREIVRDIQDKPDTDVIDDILNGDLKKLADEQILSPLVDKILDKITGKIPGVGALVKVLLDVEIDRLKEHIHAQDQELPPLIAAGVAMIVAGGIAFAVAKATEKVAYWGETVAMGAILALDISLAATRAVTKEKFDDWFDEIQGYYAFDHEPLGGGSLVYHSGLPSLLVSRAKQGTPGGVSFATGDYAKFSSRFDELHPGYRGSSAGLYISDYKKSASEWKNFADSHIEASEAEAAETDKLAGAVRSLAGASRGAGGYRQALQANGQARVFAVQQALNLRLDIARQTDARARLALERQQRRADLHAAFGRAAEVTSWTGTAAGY